MEALFVFIIAIGIVILQVIMIVKFFQIAADVREIKNLQSMRMTQSSSEDIKETKNENDSRDNKCGYSLDGEDVTFSDGLSGKIKIYSGYSECSIITEDGYELLYNNKEYAIAALHDYLKNHVESKEGLYTKRKYNK